jgi:diaminohydroxyphosphoribosylaminopyrimidine deaminase/5-amino-6-(5-phosphoribosylamino)uracil reductase
MFTKYTRENVKFMNRALELAKKGGENVFPNPMVGCVIAKNGRVIAESYHKIFGGLHAEAGALEAAGYKAKGADLYVNLEPCNHYGKQPPCSLAIIKAGIKKVFCAQIDSNKKTCGKGLKTLREAGVETNCGLLGKEAQKLNKDFIKHIRNVRPHAAIKFAMSLDGKIATKNYNSKWITSAQSRNFAHKLRARYDAILVGFNTVMRDNPELTSHGRGKNPVRVIVDENLKTPKGHNVLDAKTPTVIVCGANAKNIPARFKKEGIVLLPIDFGEFRKDFKIIIKKLNDIGLKRILIEGGGEIIASALSCGAADEIFAFIAPLIIGGRTAVTPVEGEGISLVKNSLKIKNMKMQKIGSDILITGNL